MIPKSIHKCEPSVFFKVLVSFTRVLMADESADVDEKAEDFIVNVLPGLIEGYAAEDADETMLTKQDETGLFFKCLTKRTVLATRNVTAEIKDRLTVMVCCYLTDNDKVEILVIVKIQKSRCFKVFTGPIFRQQKSLDELGTV
jgi:hypothetical protein